MARSISRHHTHFFTLTQRSTMTPEERKAYQEYLDDFDPTPIGNGEDYLYPLSADAWLEDNA